MDKYKQHTQLWSPNSQVIERSNLMQFTRFVNSRSQIELSDFPSLYDWSIHDPESFWRSVAEFTGLISSKLPEKIYEYLGGDLMQADWFPGVHLNFAENLLRRSDDAPAIIFWSEDLVKERLTFRQLRTRVASFANYLKTLGLQPGDRVAAYAPNLPGTLVALLATTSLGLVWSSCGAEAGVEGAVERFSQVEPKVLITADGFSVKGEKKDLIAKAQELVVRVPSIKNVIALGYLKDTVIPPEFFSEKNIPASSDDKIEFIRVPWDHPLYIMFSSGTTGKPKCIVHRTGGVLLEHLKELVLHTDLKPDDRIFYQTTCGWMMWNWLVSSLAVGATVILYDGHPLAAQGKVLWDLAEQEEITVFGTNASYLANIENLGITPAKTHKLPKLRSILSTGSPLLPDSFSYVYRDIKKDVQLSSISGGTDIVGCFALGAPTLPVYQGELQSRSLGLKVEVWDESGKPVKEQKGDLVCSAPFPSMPHCFLNDPDNERYKAAYFDYFPGIWRHGDFAEITSHDGMIIHGRSDTTLNPGGVRIGTAEIYRQVAKFSDSIVDSIAVGIEKNGTERILLFVETPGNTALPDNVKTALCHTLKKFEGPFHVPWKIIPCPEIPRTVNFKKSELAVKRALQGDAIPNREVLANPSALDYFFAMKDKIFEEVS